jgi:hypothetical protein
MAVIYMMALAVWIFVACVIWSAARRDISFCVCVSTDGDARHFLRCCWRRLRFGDFLNLSRL